MACYWSLNMNEENNKQYLYIVRERFDSNLGVYTGKCLLANLPLSEEEVAESGYYFVEDPTQHERFLKAPSIIFKYGQPYPVEAVRYSKYQNYDPNTNSFYVPRNLLKLALEESKFEVDSGLDFVFAQMISQLEQDNSHTRIYESMLLTYYNADAKTELDSLLNPEIFDEELIEEFGDLIFDDYTGNNLSIQSFIQNFMNLRKPLENLEQFLVRMEQERGAVKRQLDILNSSREYAKHICNVTSNLDLLRSYVANVHAINLNDLIGAK